MKALLLMIALVSVGVQAGTPIETLVPVDEIYAPEGFDANDNSEIIVSGFLPNLCHKSPMVKSEIKNDVINISVSALKYDASNPFCPEMVVPFLQSVKVGILDKGNYKILVNGKSPYEKKSSIKILESVSNALDDHIYANVSYVDDAQDGSNHIKLKGYNPSDCLVLEKVEFVSNKSNTLSVLPIMKKVRDFCPMKMSPFAYDVEVPELLPNKNKVLLHVRGMDGASVNSLLHLEK